MVNPKSELYEKHKDWVIHLPNRDEYYFRNQLVLDLSNPKVQDYVFGVVDNLMTNILISLSSNGIAIALLQIFILFI